MWPLQYSYTSGYVFQPDCQADLCASQIFHESELPRGDGFNGLKTAMVTMTNLLPQAHNVARSSGEDPSHVNIEQGYRQNPGSIETKSLPQDTIRALAVNDGSPWMSMGHSRCRLMIMTTTGNFGISCLTYFEDIET